MKAIRQNGVDIGSKTNVTASTLWMFDGLIENLDLKSHKNHWRFRGTTTAAARFPTRPIPRKAPASHFMSD